MNRRRPVVSSESRLPIVRPRTPLRCTVSNSIDVDRTKKKTSLRAPLTRVKKLTKSDDAITINMDGGNNHRSHQPPQKRSSSLSVNEDTSRATSSRASSFMPSLDNLHTLVAETGRSLHQLNDGSTSHKDDLQQALRRATSDVARLAQEWKRLTMVSDGKLTFSTMEITVFRASERSTAKSSSQIDASEHCTETRDKSKVRTWLEKTTEHYTHACGADTTEQLAGSKHKAASSSSHDNGDQTASVHSGSIKYREPQPILKKSNLQVWLTGGENISGHHTDNKLAISYRSNLVQSNCHAAHRKTSKQGDLGKQNCTDDPVDSFLEAGDTGDDQERYKDTLDLPLTSPFSSLGTSRGQSHQTLEQAVVALPAGSTSVRAEAADSIDGYIRRTTEELQAERLRAKALAQLLAENEQLLREQTERARLFEASLEAERCAVERMGEERSREQVMCSELLVEHQEAIRYSVEDNARALACATLMTWHWQQLQRLGRLVWVLLVFGALVAVFWAVYS